MRVVIIADGAPAAEAVHACFEPVPSFSVVGFIDGRRPCHEALALARPDLVVLYAPDAEAATASRIPDLRAATTAKMVMLTRDMDSAWLRDACGRGIDAVVSVAVGTAGIGNLVRHVVSGAVYQPLTPAAAPAAPVVLMHTDLTARELEILRLVAGGASNSQVARKLWITEQTVKFHLSNTYRKLGVSNRTQAANYAHVHGLLAAGGLTESVPDAVAA
jgi:DNA-binding NarL/FixJ family response regulator